jgi:hypothetical protein
MIQKRDEGGDGALEVDVVLPERVISIDEKRLGSIYRTCKSIINVRQMRAPPLLRFWATSCFIFSGCIAPTNIGGFVARTFIASQTPVDDGLGSAS